MEKERGIIMCDCRRCDYDTYNKKMNYEECSCACLMTQEQYDTYFGEQRNGCPFFCEKRRIDFFVRPLQAIVV